MIALRNVLVATDFGEPSASALRYGAELARRFGASLHVLHVLDDLSAQLTPWAVANRPASGSPPRGAGLRSTAWHVSVAVLASR